MTTSIPLSLKGQNAGTPGGDVVRDQRPDVRGAVLLALSPGGSSKRAP